MITYLQSKGHTFKNRSGEQVTNCPFCKEESGHLYINTVKNVFYCHKCSESGNIWKLRKLFGDKIVHSTQEMLKYRTPPVNRDKELNASLNDQAMEYLKAQRGIKEHIIKQFNLGLDKGFISFPYYKAGKLVNIKYRSIENKEFRREKDCESTLYNIDNIDKTKNVLVVEGEFDCLAAVQMGITNTISIPIGAIGWNPTWLDFFDSCIAKVYIALDNDKAGNEGAEKLSKRIGIDKCLRVKLPQKDMNECLMSGIAVMPYLKDAEQYTIKEVLTIADAIDLAHEQFLRPDKGKGFKLRDWDRFNHVLGGLREGEITVITGETGSGKTTYGLNVIYKLLLDDQSVFIASTEMRIAQVMKKLYAIHMKKPFHEFTEDDYHTAVKFFITRQVCMVNVYGRLPIDTLSEYMMYAYKKYDVKYAFLDHLHFFLDAGSDNMVQQIEKFIRGLTITLKHTLINTFVVAHPSKLKNDTGEVRMNDLKGSSAIKQDVDNVLTLWRDKNKEKQGKNVVTVNFEKVRDDAGLGGYVYTVFDAKSQTYEEE